MKRPTDDDKAEQARRAFEQAERERRKRDHADDTASGEGADLAAPEPLFRPLPTPEPYPVEAFGELAETVRAIARLSQAHEALAGQSVLGASSLTVQGLVDVRLPHGRGAVPCSLELLSIGASGDRKSTTDGYALAGVRDFEAEDAERYRRDLVGWRAEHDAWSAARARIVGAGRGRKPSSNPRADKEAMAKALEDLGPEPPAPVLPGCITSEPTAEGLVGRFAIGRPSLGLFDAEGGAVLFGHGMKDENRRRTAAVLNKAWDGAAHNRDRVGEHSRISGKRLSLHVAATPELCSEFLALRDLADNGMFSRLLVAAPPSLRGSRLYRDPDPRDLATAERWRWHTLELMRRPLPLRDPEDPATRELSPRALPMSPAALDVWRQFHDEVERELGSDGALGDVADHSNKAAELVARVACVLTVVVDLDAVEIGVETMRGAVELVAWHLDEVRRLYRGGLLSPGIRLAETVRRWLLETWAARSEAAIPNEMRATAPSDTVAMIPFRELYRLAPRLRTRAEATPVVELLLAHGWLVPAPPTPRGSGRPPGPAFFVRGEPAAPEGASDGLA